MLTSEQKKMMPEGNKEFEIYDKEVKNICSEVVTQRSKSHTHIVTFVFWLFDNM